MTLVVVVLLVAQSPGSEAPPSSWFEVKTAKGGTMAAQVGKSREGGCLMEMTIRDGESHYYFAFNLRPPKVMREATCDKLLELLAQPERR